MYNEEKLIEALDGITYLQWHKVAKKVERYFAIESIKQKDKLSLVAEDVKKNWCLGEKRWVTMSTGVQILLILCLSFNATLAIIGFSPKL